MHAQLILVARVTLASVLGYLIGWEREWRQSPAGERTFGLIALGSAGAASVSLTEFGSNGATIIGGILAGIGFLGGGLIIDRGDGRRRLTSAATVWAAAIIGVFAGIGEYILAVVSTVLVLLILESAHMPLVKRLDPEGRGGDRPDRSPDP